MRTGRLLSTAAIIGLSLALSGCLTWRQEAWRGGAYGEGDGGGIEVNTADYNLATAPKACVNNLEIYRAHLQAPEAVTKDLHRPVNSYINQAGGARAAINVVHAETNDLEGALVHEQARREVFDNAARAQSDAAIEVLEDGIFLNHALVEAMECRL